MLQRLRKLSPYVAHLWESLADQFRHPLELRLRRLKSLPALRFRPFEERDTQRCLELYRINEAGRFPRGIDKAYEEILKKSPQGYMVVEKDGRIIATCGVSNHEEHTLGWLGFGLVDPACHCQGVGTAMLLVRLVLLGRLSPQLGVGVVLCAVDDSAPYYRKFGFLPVSVLKRSEGDPMEHVLRLGLTTDLFKSCEAALSLMGVGIPDIVVPMQRSNEITEAQAAQPDPAAETSESQGES